MFTKIISFSKIMFLSRSFIKNTLLFVILTSIIFSKDKVDTSQTLATVGTHKILLIEFVNRLTDYLFVSGIKDNIVIRRSILNNMINELILYYYDDNRRVFTDPEYTKELKWADKQTVLAYLEDQEVYSKITATDEEIRQAYFRANEKLAVRHLYLRTEKEAEDIYQLLQTGADFNTLAYQVFTDSTLRNNGGYLGYFSWGDMDPAFEDAAYSLKIGEISKPIRTKQGYSIIKLEDRVKHPLLTENEYLNKRQHMAGVVRLRKKDQAEKEFINKNFDANKVLFNENSIQKIWNNLNQSLKNSTEINSSEIGEQECVRYLQKSYSQNVIEKSLADIPAFHKDKLSSIDNLKTAIKGIILQEILYKMATDKGYDTCYAVTRLLPNYHTSIFLEFKRKEIYDRTTLPDSTISEYYKENLKNFTGQNKINVQEIIVKTKALADSLKTILSYNENFGSLAQKFSIRDWSAKNDGIIGLDDISKFGMLKDTLWKSEIGNIIGPVKIQDLYGIFKVLEKKNGELKPFNTVKSEAQKLAKIEKSRLIMDNYLKNITPKINIIINEDFLASVSVNK